MFGEEQKSLKRIYHKLHFLLPGSDMHTEASQSLGRVIVQNLGLFLSESFFPPVPCFSVPLLVHNLIIFLLESETQQRFLGVDGKASWLGIWTGTVLRVKLSGKEDCYSKGWIWTSFSFCFLVSSHPHSLVYTSSPLARWWFCLTIMRSKSFNLLP